MPFRHPKLVNAVDLFFTERVTARTRSYADYLAPIVDQSAGRFYGGPLSVVRRHEVRSIEAKADMPVH